MLEHDLNSIFVKGSYFYAHVENRFQLRSQEFWCRLRQFNEHFQGRVVVTLLNRLNNNLWNNSYDYMMNIIEYIIELVTLYKNHNENVWRTTIKLHPI